MVAQEKLLNRSPTMPFAFVWRKIVGSFVASFTWKNYHLHRKNSTIRRLFYIWEIQLT
jgi:hypothetical protein